MSDVLSKKIEDEERVVELMSRVSFVTACGATIQDFAEEHFDVKLRHNDENVILLKEGFKSFFDNPPPEDEYISSELKIQIEHIPGICDINETIDYICSIYVAFCDCINCCKLCSCLNNKDEELMKTLLQRAPPAKDYDYELHDVICRFL